MNILDKQSPNTANGSSSSCSTSAPPSSGPITPSADCLIPNSQLIPSLAVPPSSTAPSSVSSSSAPHTPIDTLNPVNCQSDLTANGLPNRPNVSTPSSVFNNSAPNTPMPCPSVGSDANITSPALNHQLDYGDQKMFTSGPAPSSQPIASNISNQVLSPSPLNVPPPMCNDSKKTTLSNGNASNKKHCNNRNQQNNFSNINIKCENNTNVTIPKNQINFPAPNNNMVNMACNGSHLNGSVSPFDLENKMSPFVKSEFVNEFSPSLQNEMVQPIGNMQRLPNNSVGMNIQMQPNLINNAPNKMCGGNMPSHGMIKPPPMDSQYMQHQSQIFVFNTSLANQAADAVESGQFDSIVDFHLANPHTKNFLEKHSLKIQNQIRPNMWPGNIRQPRMRGPSPNGLCLRGNFNNTCFSPYNNNPPGPGPGGGPQWNGHNNWNQSQPFVPCEMNMKMSNIPPRPYGPQFNNNAHYLGDMQDLTPQQKQHRENKLAILANLQQKFLPELMESNNRPLSQPSQSNEFPNIDPLVSNNPNIPLLPDNDQLNQMIPSDYNFPPNAMMNNNQTGNEQWPKSTPFPEEKTFNGRRKSSQANQSNMAHQSPLSQQSISSPNSCITSSPGNRVPPPPYNQGLRSISSPHPASPAGTSLSLPSPRMHSNETRQTYTSGGVRSGPATPSADNANCTLINSPKSANRSSNTNSSPVNKKGKSSIDNELLLNSFPSKSEPASLMPVPSPKQIDYINTLEGHELTIHKQPNAHFQESELLNSNDLSNDLFPNDFVNICSSVNNPQNMTDINHRFSSSSTCNFDPNSKFSGPESVNRYNGFAMEGFRQTNVCSSPFNPNDGMRFSNCDSKPRMNSSTDISFTSNSMVDMNFPNSIPPMNHEGVPFPNGQNHMYNDHPENPMGSTHLQNLQKMTPPFEGSNKDGMMPNSKSLLPNMVNPGNNHMVPNSMHPNIPQNPNHRMPNFDMPCNELNEPNNFTGQNMHQSNMSMNSYPNNFGSSPRMASNISNDPQFGIHPNNSFNMPMHVSLDQSNPNGPSPMPMMMQGPQANMRFPGNVNRPVNPSNTPRYNSPNIQVKPDAPNTIQYLPSRPQGPTNTPPNRPPNLDFLQQSLSMSNKPQSNNVPYFPNNSGAMPMPPRPMQPNQAINFNPRPPLMRPQNGPMPGQPPMVPQSNDMFGRPPASNNLMNGPNNMPINSGPPNNFAPPGQVTNKTNSVPPMHAESNQSFNFSKQPFVNTSDPNYAAQFHNFQQQLYATNTRNSNNPRMTF